MNSTFKFLKKLIFDYIIGFLFFTLSTSLFTGMLPWLLGKKFRGKGGGLITSICTSGFMIFLFIKGVEISFGAMMMVTFISLIFGFGIAYYGEKFSKMVIGIMKKHNGIVVDHDFNHTTFDELHGMIVAMLPIYYFQWSLKWFITLQIIALVGFRIFDVTKPWLIKKVELSEDTLTESGAIMLDDTMAAIFTAIIVLAICIVIKSL